MEKNLSQSARKTRLHARNWQACPLCAEVARTACAHFVRELGTSKKIKDGGRQACFTFLLVSKVCSVYLYVRAIYFFWRKVLNCIFFIFTRYEIGRNAVSCSLSWSRLPGIWHCQGLWFLVSYNYLHRFLNILSWLISTSFYLNRLLGSSTVVFFVFCDLDWGEGVTVIYMGSMVMCCYGEYGWGNGFKG